eukprot:4364832-Amphidinium_carterae.2
MLPWRSGSTSHFIVEAWLMQQLMSSRSPVHAELVNFLWGKYLQVVLPGFARVSLEMLRRADELVFVKLAEPTKDTPPVTPVGRIPSFLVMLS